MASIHCVNSVKADELLISHKTMILSLITCIYDLSVKTLQMVIQCISIFGARQTTQNPSDGNDVI